MTAGMLMACVSGDYAVEHVPTAFAGTGQKTTQGMGQTRWLVHLEGS